jgi:DNA-binding NtrC family response regulator
MRSRSTRFQRAPVPASASILIYANPALNLPKALANIPFDATLRKAGYRPTTVTSQQELESSLRRGGWDLVLVDLADSSAVSKRAADSRSPVVLPVVFNATNSELAAAKQQHPRILKAPMKNQSLLDAIENALAEKPTTATKTPDPSSR